jgi:ParB/RepB/Spo0J family partition protein
MTAAKRIAEQTLVALAEPELGQVQMIPLERLDASALNPRKTFDEAGLKELAASIKQSGILSPLLVRWMRAVVVELKDGTVYDMPFGQPSESSKLIMHPDAIRTEIDDRYEIVAGHRRSEAATIAGLTEVPCIVREMDDATAADEALTENLQRVDVPALEQAEAFGELLTRHGSIEAVAARVGKDVAHVAKSLKLLTLTAWSQDALRERLITVDHALLLARLGDDDQNAALKWCLDRQAGVKVPVAKVIADRVRRLNPKAALPVEGAEAGDDFDEDGDEGETESARPSSWNHRWEPESVQRLKEHIASESGTPLSRAPWPMEEDWLLPDTGSCLDCPKNTKANTPLFGDLDITAPICTDGACFKAKTGGFVLYGIETAKKDSKDVNGMPLPVLRVSWKATTTAPRQIKNGGGVNPAQLFKAGQWEHATKKCEYARAAVTVDWSDDGNRGYIDDDNKARKPGEIVRACIEPVCKVHPKAYLKAAKSGGVGRSGQSEAERKAEYEKEEKARYGENQNRVAKAFETIAKVQTIVEPALRNILIEVLDNAAFDEKVVEKQLCPYLRQDLQGRALLSPHFAQALASLYLITQGLSIDKWSEPGDMRKEFDAACRLLGYEDFAQKPKKTAPKATPKKAVAKKKPAKKVPKKAAKK